MKIWILRNLKKYNVLGLGLMKFNLGPKWLTIPKKYTCMHLSNGYLNTVSNFNFDKVKKSAFLRTWFWPTLIKGQNNSKYRKQICSRLSLWPTLKEGKNYSKSNKNRCPHLSLKWVSKSTLKFQFRESRQKCIFSALIWPTLNDGKNSSKSH